MKTLIVITAVSLFAATAFALQSTGPAFTDQIGTPLPVFTPKPNTIKNSTITGTKAFVNHSTASKASVFRWSCTDTSGASVACKVYPNGQAAYIVSPTGEGTRGIHPDAKYFRFGKYSAATSSSIIITSEQQK